MKIENFGSNGFETAVGKVGHDITIEATGVKTPRLRAIHITQPCYSRHLGDDDLVIVAVEDLLALISELQRVAEIYQRDIESET